MFVSAPGKLILFGEHAVVYDKLGIVTAVNLRATVKAEEAKETSVKDGDVFFKVDRTELSSIRDKVEKLIEEKNYEKMKELSTDKTFCLKNVLSRCLGEKDYHIQIESEIPEVAGMGSSSAVFACIGALFKKDLEAIREISYMGDVLVHGGTPSGIDNSAVVYGRYLAFRKSEGPKKLRIAVEPPIVIGHTGIKSSTAKTVGYVRENIGRFMPYIERIDEISRKGLTALQKNDLPSVGRLMNENQKLLERIEVSHPKLEELIEIARENGALGAKLSGKGGGGVMFALCKDRAHQQKIREAFENAGFKAYSASLGAEGVRTE